MSTTDWDVNRLPDQQGKRFLVTGASAGIGYFIAEQLSSSGAEVIIAGRSEAKLVMARQAMTARIPDARLSSVVLDLADLGSVRQVPEELNARGPLDGAVFNAGVLAQQARSETVDGHELVYGTNHLGHFALAALITPVLTQSGARIVTIGSLAARRISLDLNNLESTKAPYKGFDVYKRSKLAQTLFAFELDRRLRAAGSPLRSLVAHPGGALDGLTPNRPPVFTRTLASRVRALPLAPAVQGKDHAAWPAVRALLDPNADGGQLWGPRLLGFKGRPTRETPSSVMTDNATAGKLWAASEQATAVNWLTLGV